MSERTDILLCRCAYSRAVDQQASEAVCAALAGAGAPFEQVADLCELAARRDPALKRFAQAPRLTVVACHPRAVKWLFAAAGAPLAPERAELLNLRCQGAPEILQALLDGACDPVPTMPAEGPADPVAPPEWLAWFPVIDRDRCKNCKQCLNFCLFGVYGLSGEGCVEVQNPANCKTHCPACARICPETAIIFPKHKTGPINGGPVPAQQAGEQTRVDIKEALGRDVYEALRRRGQGLGEPTAPAGGEETLERQARRLREQLDVPPELLAPLVSEGDAQRDRDAEPEARSAGRK